MIHRTMAVWILNYHRIGYPKGERMTVTPEAFLLQMRILKALRRTVSSMDTIASALQKGDPLPARGVAITFDDGYRDVYLHAFPVLRGMGFPATVYMVSDRVGDLDRWNSEKGTLRPLCSWKELREMASAGIQVGSHTRTHPSLTSLSESAVREELEGSKEELEKGLSMAVRHFCYPYGHHDFNILSLVREAGYGSACTTLKGPVHPGDDPYALRRVTLSRNTHLLRFFWRMAMG